MLADHTTAPIDERLRATLGFLRTMTVAPDELDADALAAVRAAGVGDAALRDAIYVAFAFNVITRIADSFAAVPLSQLMSREQVLEHEAGFLERGYL